jgi:membrane protease YdiL (CAAX protease family)
MATAAPLQPAAPHKGIKALLALHPLVSFFVLAFAGTWLFELPYVLSEYGAGLLPTKSPVLLWTSPVSVFMGPFLSAFVMTGVTEGREGVHRFLRRFVLWRVGFRWYLFALFGVPVIALLSVVVLPGTLASYQGLGVLAPLPLLGIFLYALFPGGALGEEPGWRGFALPRLQSMHGPLLGSLILGVLWGLWHLPLFLTPWNVLSTFNVVVFVLTTTCLAIMYTWVFNNTKGSVLMAILIHATFNWFTIPLGTLFPAPILSNYGLLPILGGFGVFAVVLVALTRGRLGYQHYRQEVEPDPATAST